MEGLDGVVKYYFLLNQYYEINKHNKFVTCGIDAVKSTGSSDLENVIYELSSVREFILSKLRELSKNDLLMIMNLIETVFVGRKSPAELENITECNKELQSIVMTW